MKNIGELLAELGRQNIKVWADGGQLRIRAAREALTADLKEELTARKEDILRFLRETGSAHPLPPLRPVSRAEPPPLSHAQQRLWFLDQMGSGFAYNIPFALRLRGRLDGAALERSLNEVVRRHESLRTCFGMVADRPCQIVLPEARIELPRVDLGQVPEAERDLEARREAREEALRSFDLSRGPMLRARLLRLAESEHILLLTLHHIAADGWSVEVLIRELGALYGAFSHGQPSPLPELELQYADFAAWQRQWLRGEVMERQLAFWKERLRGAPALLPLPTDRPRPPVESFRGKEWRVGFEAGLTEALKTLARESGTTLFTVLLAAYQILLARYSGQEDVVVGVPIANRNRLEIEPLIGFFVNTLALRVDLSGNPRFSEVLERVKRTSHQAQDHQDLPFERLVEELQVERNLSYNPVVQVMFALQTARVDAFVLPGLEVCPCDFEETQVRVDLELHLWERNGGLAGSCVYAADLFEEASIVRMMEHFRNLLEGIAADPARPMLELPLLGGAERQRLLIDWNRTDADFRRDACVQRGFEEWAERSPDAPAVVSGEASLSYRELNRRANRLAHRLRALGVGPDSLVAVCLERSADMVAAVLGILKAGGAYLPLDPAYPGERLAFMLNDAGQPLLLSRTGLLAGLPDCAAQVLCLDRDAAAIAGCSPDNPEPSAGPGNLAYVIYTSGSTGRPKGVMIEHRGLCNLVEFQSRAFAVGPGSRFLQFVSLSFDVAASDIFTTLGSGATLYPVPRDAELAGAPLTAFLNRHAITHLELPAPILALLDPRELPQVRVVIAGGEACPRDTVADWSRNHRFFNAYGVTEATVCSTVQPGSGDSLRLPIGRPIANTRVYIVDRLMQPVPVGVPGELCIGGAGLARGYWNRPDLTREKFVASPFGPERLYKTGDLARWLADGRIEFLGRIDHQVKIRGFRIEPGEIESVLEQHPGVREAVALVRERRPGERHIVGYLVPGEAGADTVHAHLAQWQTLNEADTVQAHLAQWQTLNEAVYGQPAREEDPGGDFVGWNSSYDGQPIAAAAMQEWVEATLAEIRALGGRRILEIGCGSGLLLSRLASEAASCLGTDCSRAALDRIRRAGNTIRGFERVRLDQRMADDFTGLDQEGFDLVILNSVIQYFPGVDYLLRVLEGAVARVRPGGHVYLGDLRSLPLLEAFHASVQTHRAEAGISRAELQRQVRQRLRDEEELALDPAFFQALREHLPRIEEARISLKRGRDRNELTCFRYQAVLRIAGNEAHPSAPAAAISWQPWREASWTLDTLRRHLRETRPARLGLRGVPNARLRTETEILRWLHGTHAETVGQLRRRLDGAAPAGFDPEDLWALAGELPYSVGIGESLQGQPGDMDVWFEQRGESAAVAGLPPPVSIHSPSQREGVGGRENLDIAGVGYLSPLPTSPRWGEESERLPLPDGPRKPWRAYANDPLLGKRHRGLVSEVRGLARERLPEYMVPGAFVVLDALPLNANGKLDRQALPAPEAVSAEAGQAPPETPAEQALAAIWAEVLGLARVGRHDHFFELGGHSLLATQVVSRLRQAFGIELGVRSLFEAPTLAELAARVDGRQPGADLPPPLATADRSGALPLSFAQQRLWFLAQMEGSASAYNTPAPLRLNGPLDLAALTAALGEIVRRHEILRTRFPAPDGEPRQQIDPWTEPSVPLVDLAPLPEPERSRELRRHLATAWRAFDLSRGPLFRASLFRLAPEQHILFLNAHHIIADGWSMGVLLKELDGLYRAFLDRRPSPLPPLAHQYADFAVWQRGWLRGAALNRQLEYWRGALADSPAVLDLPTDHPRPQVQTFRGAFVAFELEAEACAALNESSRRAGASLFMTLYAGFAVLLSRHGGQDDIVIGTPIANRHHRELEPLIGFFVNTLPLRISLAGRPSFTELLRRARKTTLDAYAHQDIPFELLVGELKIERNLGHNPLFQAMIALNNTPALPRRMGRVTVAPLDLEDGAVAKFDLTLFVTETGNTLKFELEYNTDLFAPDTIARMAGHLHRLLQGIAADPGRPVAEIPLLTEAERHQALFGWNDSGWNDTAADFPRELCLHQCFEIQAERTPDAVAVVFGEQSLGYRELNARANRLAHHLQTLGVGPATRVALCLDRSLEMAVAVLGILKAGAAYVPLDPSYPGERLAFMLEDAAAPVLVSLARLRETLPAAALRRVELDLDGPEIAGHSPENPSGGAGPEHPAYLLYTSGSTGRPKGVSMPHRPLCNLIAWQAREIPGAARTLQFAPLNFDVSCQEMFATWSTGGTLILMREELRRDPLALLRFLAAQGVERLFLPYVALQQLAEAAGAAQIFPPSLREVVTAGEPLRITPAIAALFAATGAGLHNQYGPTESHVVSAYRLPAGVADWPTLPPIGRPIANARLYLLDADRQPVPIGVAGEIHIGGESLAQGYWNRPELTAERFIADPYAPSGGRMYRTGDFARRRPDGEIQFLGRMDHQVKLRGFRIELGEVESVLGHHPEVREAVAVVREDQPGNPRLVAYVTPAAAVPDPAALAAFLKSRLPDYMIPSAFVALEALPLTASGKLDRRALPEPDRAAPASAYLAPATATETLIAAIWAGVLGRERIGTDANFFDLGGHSLLVIKVRSELQERLQREIAVVDLFRHPTIARLARHLDQGTPAHDPVAGAEARAHQQRDAFKQRRLAMQRRTRNA